VTCSYESGEPFEPTIGFAVHARESNSVRVSRVKARAAAKEAKAAPEVKPLMAAVKAVEKALVAASGAENNELAESLSTVRETLGAELVRMGLVVA
jgi:hypothetical protein